MNYAPRVFRSVIGRALAVAALALSAWPRAAPGQTPPTPPAESTESAQEGAAAAPSPPPAAPPPAYAPAEAAGQPTYAPGYAPPAYPPSVYPPPGYVPPAPGYPPPGYGYAPRGPEIMDYAEGKPVPPGYRVDERVRRGPIVAGLIMAGSTYAFNVLGATLIGRGREWLYVPVVGGWAYTPELCETTALRCGVLMVHNLTHTVGVALVIYGLAARRKLLVRNDVSLVVAPTSAGSGAAVGLSARF